MSHFSRIFRRSVLCLLGTICGICAAQQFVNLPQVQPTGGRVTSLLAGSFQNPASGADFLYVNAATDNGCTPPATTCVLAGTDLYAQGYTAQGKNQILFNGATNVVAALGNFAGSQNTDFAFAVSGVGSYNLCVYYGTGALGSSNSLTSSYIGGNAYPPVPGNGSSCIQLPVQPQVLNPPNFSAIVPYPFTTGSSPQLLVEDSANDVLYCVAVGPTGMNIQFILHLTLGPVQFGPGPIYVGDFNGNGYTDFILNNQTNHTATVFFGSTNQYGLPVFTWYTTYSFDKGVYSMLLQDMDGDGHPDMVVEGSDGSIEIHHGNLDGTFVQASEGGTGSGNSLTGDGGRLAAIDPNTLNILTTTPIGLSVLTDPSHTRNYSLKNIYNIGPGRSSFALSTFFNSGNLGLAVDSPEGVAIVSGNADGSFQTSNAYSTLAPALGTTVGQFRDTAINPSDCLDVVAATGSNGSPVQGQLLIGNSTNGKCDGTFTTAPTPTNTTGNPSGIPSNLWSNILSGQFNGEPNTDIAYSLTGLPLPTTGSGLYIQYGNGDGTFNPPVAVTGESSGNTLYGDSLVCDLQNISLGAIAEDIVNADANGDETLLAPSGISTSGAFNLGLNEPGSGLDFNQVAEGFFKLGVVHLGGPDLVFQSGAQLVPYKNNDYTGNNFTPLPALTGTPPLSQLVPAKVLLTDMDGDGNSDVVALYHNTASDPANPSASTPNWLYIWWGIGDGTFNPTPYTLQLDRNYYLAAVADMNGDGLPDIVLSDGYLVGILYNQGGRGQGQFVSDCGSICQKEAHFLAGQGINSLSLVKLNGVGTPSLIVANGGATISNAIALGGTTKSSLTLTPNPSDIDTGGITVLRNYITSQSVTGTLTSNPTPSNIGAPFTMTATFSSSLGVAEPTGTVTFYFNATVVTGCAPVVLTQGATSSTASCVVPAGVTTAAGTFPISAVYSGDSNNSPFTASANQTIATDPTTTTLFLCIGPTQSCQSVGIVSPTPPYIANLSMIYGQTFNGVTSVTASNPSTLLGTTVLNDVYNGVQLPPLCTLQTLSMNPCPPSVGTGTQAGVNVFTSSYVPGTQDAINGPSTSPSVTITVTRDTVMATVVGSPSAVPVGQPVTLTATLAGVNAPLGTAASPVGYYLPPSGTVVFMEGGTALTCNSAATLVPSATGVNSTATCTTSALPVGTDAVTVSYGGDLDFQPTTSATAFNQTITPLVAPSFSLAATPNPVSVGVGYDAVLTVTVTPQNGFSEGVSLACGALPSEATCIFTSAAVAPGGGTSTLFVQTTSPHGCGTSQPYFVGGNGGGPGLVPLALPALAGLIAIFIPGKRRWLRALLAVSVTAGFLSIAGCGNCTDLGTRPATYTFQVIGTSTTTGEIQSQTVTLNVTI